MTIEEMANKKFPPTTEKMKMNNAAFQYGALVVTSYLTMKILPYMVNHNSSEVLEMVIETIEELKGK